MLEQAPFAFKIHMFRSRDGRRDMEEQDQPDSRQEKMKLLQYLETFDAKNIDTKSISD